MNPFRSILASVLAVAFLAISAPAQDHPEHPEHPKKKAATAGAIEATVEGVNFCLGCSLQKDKGAAAQCSKYGHQHALKVTSATVDGKENPEMTGWVLHYMETDNAQPLIKEHHEETVKMTGKVYADERVFEVAKLESSNEAKKPEHPEHPK
ncbi:MAG: hypothetical protein AB1752_06680 [Candidatus Zixiibacteriota bacterium]